MEIKISLEAKYQVLRELMEHIEQTPQKVFEAALTLTAIRNEFSNNIAFRDELDEQGIAINKDDRAAMIRFGQASQQVQDTIKHFMRKEGRISFRYLPSTLWEESSLSSEDSPPIMQNPEIVEITPEVPAFLEKPSSKTIETTITEEVENKKPEIEYSPIHKSSKLFGRERAEEIVAFFSGDKLEGIRALMGKVDKKGWPFVIESFDLGLISPQGTKLNSAGTASRCLFNLRQEPTASKRTVAILEGFDLTKATGCKKAEETLMPFLRKNAEALKTDPESFAKLWAEESRSKRDETIKAEQEEKKARIMSELTARGEKEVIVCGVKLWPPEHTNIKTYSYEQLREAWFLFLDVEGVACANIMSKSGRHDRAIRHRFVANKLTDTVSMFKNTEHHEVYAHVDFVADAYRELARALQNGQDEKLQTSIPWHDIRIASSK